MVTDGQLNRRAEEGANSEVTRMLDRGLARGWAARSEAGGRGAQLMCQLATGTVSRASLLRVLQFGGAEAAWSRLFGTRQLRMRPDHQ